MMILVSISRRSGMFQYLAIWSAQAAKAHPAGILFILQITTAVLSAFLDNVTTVLLIVPVTLAICKTLKVPAYPYLFAEIIASNIGGTATLIGDPPNILIGSQAGLSFNEFVYHLTPVIVIVMVVQAVIIHFLWGKDLKASHDAEARVMAMNPADSIEDWLLLKQSLVVLAVVMVAFVLARPLHLEPATIAMFGAAMLMLLDNWAHHSEKAAQNIHQTFGDVEWITIFFFIGLFVVVHGVDVGGLLAAARQQAGGGDRRQHGARRLRHPVGVGVPVGDRRQHPVRRHHDPADQEHGAGLWRRRQDRAAVVVPVARRLPRRQRHADRRLGQPDGRRHRRAQRGAVPLHHLHALCLPDDGGVGGDLPRLCLVAVFLSRLRPLQPFACPDVESCRFAALPRSASDDRGLRWLPAARKRSRERCCACRPAFSPPAC